MPAWFKSLWTAIGAKQNRAFVWACLFFAAFGAIELGAPLDNGLRAFRDRIRDRPATASIALILPDDPLDGGTTGWSWSRADLAALVAKLRAAGAEKVAIARLIPDASTTPDSLAQELGKMPERSVVAMRFDVDGETGERRLLPPPRDLARVADVAAINQYFDGFGRVEVNPYRIAASGKQYRSLASMLAGQDGGVGELVPIDYAINIRSIPVISASALNQAKNLPRLQGKTIVIGSVESRMNARDRGRVASAYAHILGAETLLAGRPVQVGWLLPFVVGLVAAALIWFGGRRKAIAATVLATTAFITFPMALETRLIFVDPVPGMLLVFAVVAIRTYRSYRRDGARENSLSGLPNLAALKERRVAPNEAVVVAKIANYAELVSVVTVHEKALAEQIASRISAGGDLSLFHGDGGAFAWIVPAAAIEGLGDHLDALHAFFMKPITVGSWQVDVTLAFGVDIASGKDMATCFACASVAADDAVDHRMRWKFYESSRLGEAEWNVSLLGKLDAAIESGEVWVAYQPQIDIATSHVNGFEALVRWSHPERGAISPEQFVSVAESHGRIDRLTYFVLDDALAMLASLGPDHEVLGVAVNVSARMFGRADFLPKVRAALKRHGIAPARLTMEITESAAAESEKDMLSCVAGMIKMGVQVSIDDYGTGYSTLDYLKKLKAHELKIDRGFIAGMDRNRSDFMLVKATIDLAHSLGHRVVAEGVETIETMEMLSKLGCDLAQGFLIARPMPRAEIESYIQLDPKRQAA